MDAGDFLHVGGVDEFDGSGLEPDEVRRVQARHPFLKPMTVPAGAYRGIDRPLSTVGAWNVVMARPDLPEEAAWRFIRALHRAEAELGRRLEQARESTAANTLTAAPEPRHLHAGTARYLGEAGLMR